ncbi:MAG: PIN/TRAM domain-containing protein [Candidatus Microsaccharimonas sp.]
MDILIIIVLLAIAAETTYLTATALRKSQKTALAPVFIDTSVLIDGRIIAVAESGFLTRPLYIPRSVVGELQFLADNADTDKRTRARHGLDIINQLQSITSIQTVIFPDGVKAEEGVDNRLLSLAKKHHGSLCTIDYNLNKVAVVEGIEVLNVNELAKSLRMAYLPGERAFIELSQKGNDQHQGVGHLEDGTMVVVEHAYKQIGSTVEVEFIRSLQTAAGKMMFAKLAQPAVKQKASQLTASRSTKPVEAKKPRVKGTAPVAASTSRASAAPAKPKSQPQQRQTRQQDTQGQQEPPKAPSKRPAQRRRPRSPEDSMVELANRQ